MSNGTNVQNNGAITENCQQTWKSWQPHTNCLLSDLTKPYSKNESFDNEKLQLAKMKKN